MFDYRGKINRILLELSNLCHYSTEHKKCPLHLAGNPVILPKNIIYHVIDTVSEWNYAGVISFHAYNEPGIDPRLFQFISYAKMKCPDSYVSIMTNGYYLDENLLSEYRDAGLDEMFISAYSEKEYQRFLSYRSPLKVTIQRPKLDERMNIYDRPVMDLHKHCLAPYNELMISREGYVGLCCLDWKRSEVFGSLHERTLEEILRSSKMQEVYEKLSQGRRENDICRRCDWSR